MKQVKTLNYYKKNRKILEEEFSKSQKCQIDSKKLIHIKKKHLLNIVK